MEGIYLHCGEHTRIVALRTSRDSPVRITLRVGAGKKSCWVNIRSSSTASWPTPVRLFVRICYSVPSQRYTAPVWIPANGIPAARCRRQNIRLFFLHNCVRTCSQRSSGRRLEHTDSVGMRRLNAARSLRKLRSRHPCRVFHANAETAALPPVVLPRRVSYPLNAPRSGPPFPTPVGFSLGEKGRIGFSPRSPQSTFGQNFAVQVPDFEGGESAP